jgi:hypothetical protein
LAGGLVAIAAVDAPKTRGIWWGIPVQATSLAGNGRLPLVLARMAQWLSTGRAPPEGQTSMKSESDLTPRPPDSARDANAVIRTARREPTPLRSVFLWCALFFCVAEGARRCLSFRKGPSPGVAATEGIVRGQGSLAIDRERKHV